MRVRDSFGPTAMYRALCLIQGLLKESYKNDKVCRVQEGEKLILEVKEMPIDNTVTEICVNYAQSLSKDNHALYKEIIKECENSLNKRKIDHDTKSLEEKLRNFFPAGFLKESINNHLGKKFLNIFTELITKRSGERSFTVNIWDSDLQTNQEKFLEKWEQCRREKLCSMELVYTGRLNEEALSKIKDRLREKCPNSTFQIFIKKEKS